MTGTVVKHNGFIVAKYRTPALTKAHGRILAFLISKLHSKKDEEFQYVEILPVEYRELIGNTHYTLKQIKWDLGELTSMTCMIETDKKTAFCHLVDYAEVEHDTGMVRMRLGEEMKPYLLQLHGNYTMYELEEFLQLKSKHSQRLYEIFQKEKNQNSSVKIEHTLDEFKEMLGLVEYKNKGNDMVLKYPRWADFERRVLEGARDELCEIGILFEYEPVIQKRKTVAVKLHFNPTAKTLDEQTFEEFQMIKGFPIPAIAKVDISRCCSRASISQAIKDSLESGDYKPLVKLTPKTRAARLKMFEAKLRQKEKAVVKQTNLEQEQDLFS